MLFSGLVFKNIKLMFLVVIPRIRTFDVLVEIFFSWQKSFTQMYSAPPIPITQVSFSYFVFLLGQGPLKLPFPLLPAKIFTSIQYWLGGLLKVKGADCYSRLSKTEQSYSTLMRRCCLSCSQFSTNILQHPVQDTNVDLKCRMNFGRRNLGPLLLLCVSLVKQRQCLLFN